MELYDALRIARRDWDASVDNHLADDYTAALEMRNVLSLDSPPPVGAATLIDYSIEESDPTLRAELALEYAAYRTVLLASDEEVEGLRKQT
jgi:hypothetical protein